MYLVKLSQFHGVTDFLLGGFSSAKLERYMWAAGCRFLFSAQASDNVINCSRAAQNGVSN